MRSYTGSGVSSDWLSENVTLANRDTRIWRDSKGVVLGLLHLSRCDPIGRSETSVTNQQPKFNVHVTVHLINSYNKTN